MDAEQAAKLRKPFPKETIGKLPRGGIMLDYVGHAAVTDRLLAVDPDWTWEPLAVDEYGLPMLDKSHNLWIRLTIAGVTRLGVGDGKNAKECIGDAIRNAAMRFGVALDLWAKEDLHEFETAERVGLDGRKPYAGATKSREDKPETGELITDRQLKALHTAFSKRGITDRDERLKHAINLIGHDIESSKELSRKEAGLVLDDLTTSQGDEPSTDPWPNDGVAADPDPWGQA